MADDAWPRVMTAKPLGQRRLAVSLHNGEHWVIDLDSLIRRREACWRLRQERYFCRVTIDPLGALTWPEGEDLAPESLERYRSA